MNNSYDDYDGENYRHDYEEQVIFSKKKKNKLNIRKCVDCGCPMTNGNRKICNNCARQDKKRFCY